MNPRYRHEDVSAVPSGWKVRTVSHGDHRVRVAFPPGRRHTGSGRLVSILHPTGENPCTLRSQNPAELVVMGANPPRSRNAEAKRETREKEAEHKKVFKCPHCRHKFSPHEVEAGEFRKHMAEHRAERLGSGSNPRVEVIHGDNPQLETIVEEFSGTPAEWVDVYDEPHMMRGQYAQLGPLIALYVKPVSGGQVRRIGAPEIRTGWKKFWDDDPPMIVTDRTAKQIYFVGGNQDLTPSLEAFGVGPKLAVRTTIELGQVRRIDYECRKEHVADPDEDQWKHDHGEENGVLPTLIFDVRSKRMLYKGGDYRIEGAWIRN